MKTVLSLLADSSVVHRATQHGLRHGSKALPKIRSPAQNSQEKRVATGSTETASHMHHIHCYNCSAVGCLFQPSRLHSGLPRQMLPCSCSGGSDWCPCTRQVSHTSAASQPQHTAHWHRQNHCCLIQQRELYEYGDQLKQGMVCLLLQPQRCHINYEQEGASMAVSSNQKNRHPHNTCSHAQQGHWTPSL